MIEKIEKTKKLRIKKTRDVSASSRVDTELDPHNENEVEEEIGDQADEQSDNPILDRARGILGGGVDKLQDKLGAPPEKLSRKTREKQEDSISTLLTAILVMMIAGWKVPTDLKPNEEEVNAVSGCATSILLRHINISGRLTADVIDAIGIVATVSVYYTRTSEGWRNYTLSQRAPIIAAVDTVEIEEKVPYEPIIDTI